MNTLLRKLMPAIMFLFGCCSIAMPNETIAVNPEKVRLGRINVGEKVVSSVCLTNNGEKEFVIERVLRSCRCQEPIVDFNSIPPGQQRRLKVVTLRKETGYFGHKIRIVPKGQVFAPVTLLIQGEAIQTLRVSVGWVANELQTVKRSDPIPLGCVRLNGGDVLHISVQDSSGKRLRTSSINTIASKCFSLIGCEVSHAAPLVGDGQACLHLTLGLKTGLDKGVFRDDIEIWTKDRRMAVVPVRVRLVGNIYVEPDTIYFGRLSQIGQSALKPLRVHFRNDSSVWPRPQWRLDGQLAQAIALKTTRLDRDQGRLEIVVEVDPDRVESLSNGFQYCNIRIFEREPNEPNAVSAIVYGYK